MNIKGYSFVKVRKILPELRPFIKKRHGNVPIQKILVRPPTNCDYCKNIATHGSEHNMIKRFCEQHSKGFVEIDKLLICELCDRQFTNIYQGILYCENHRISKENVFVCDYKHCLLEAIDTDNMKCKLHSFTNICKQNDCKNPARNGYCRVHKKKSVLKNFVSEYLKSLKTSNTYIYKPFLDWK